jgi:hypothetical protein
MKRGGGGGGGCVCKSYSMDSLLLSKKMQKNEYIRYLKEHYVHQKKLLFSYLTSLLADNYNCSSYKALLSKASH